MINTTKTNKKLVTLRIEKGVSQTAAADGIGIPQTTLSSYEMGYRRPRIDKAQKIANYYGVSVDEIDFSGWRK